jgi:hypothetical protein
MRGKAVIKNELLIAMIKGGYIMSEDFGHPDYPFNECYYCGKNLSVGESEVDDNMKVCCDEYDSRQ